MMVKRVSGDLQRPSQMGWHVYTNAVLNNSNAKATLENECGLYQKAS